MRWQWYAAAYIAGFVLDCCLDYRADRPINLIANLLLAFISPLIMLLFRRGIKIT